MPSLLDLPPELLNEITTDALRFDYPLRPLSDRAFAELHPERSPAAGLLAVNRQLHVGCVPIFYGINKFTITLSAFKAALEGVSPALLPLEFTRHILLGEDIFPTGRDESSFPLRRVEDLLTLLIASGTRLHTTPFRTSNVTTRARRAGARTSAWRPRRDVILKHFAVANAYQSLICLANRLGRFASRVCGALVLESWLEDSYSPLAESLQHSPSAEVLRALGPTVTEDRMEPVQNVISEQTLMYGYCCLLRDKAQSRFAHAKRLRAETTYHEGPEQRGLLIRLTVTFDDS